MQTFKASSHVALKIGACLGAFIALLTVLFILTALALDSGRVVSADSEQKTMSSEGTEGSTALLFLMDESGGVSGKCAEANPDQVFVTDEDGLRYKLVRFYLQLWQAYYSPERWILSASYKSDKQPDLSLPGFELGVAQFAQSYDPIIPLTATKTLWPSDAPGGSWKKFESQLLALPRPPQPATDTSWFCKTNYPDALGKAGLALSSSQASNKVLVLFTDGSFLASELEPYDAMKRDAARRDTADRLKELHKTGIQVFVMLWGANKCRQSRDCNLDQPNYERRNVDLDLWAGWQSQGLITLVGDSTPIVSLGRQPPIAVLLPGMKRTADFLNFPGGKMTKVPLKEFHGSTEAVRVVLITSGAGEYNVIKVLQDPDETIIPLAEETRQWFQSTQRITPLPNKQPCTWHKWQIQATPSSEMAVYYWLDIRWSDPKLEPISVAPHVDLSRDRRVTVTVALQPDTHPWYPECHQLVVTVGDQIQRKFVGAQADPIIFSFDLADLPWGTVPITADLVIVDRPEISRDKVSRGLEIRWKPEVAINQKLAISEADWAKLKTGNSESITLTVPITYASRIPGFAPTFSLWPEEFEYCKGIKSPVVINSVGDSACASLDRAHNVGQISARTTADMPFHTITYTVVFPYEGMVKCDYHHLLIDWQIDGSPRTCIWYDIRPDVSLPTPSPTPAIVTGENPPPKPPLWLLVPILGIGVGIAGVVIYIRKDRTRRSV